MNAPFSPPPASVEVGGRTVPVETDFRLFTALEPAVIQRDEEAIAEAVNRFYRGSIPVDLDGAMDRLIWFYRCGREETEGGGGTGRRCYDFQQDADALCASFYQAYHIDLSRDALHWWTFRGLMFGLPADTPFMQRVHYRTADTTGMSRDEKKRYVRLKERFALRETGKRQTLEERDAWMKEYVSCRFEEWGRGT